MFVGTKIYTRIENTKPNVIFNSKLIGSVKKRIFERKLNEKFEGKKWN